MNVGTSERQNVGTLERWNVGTLESQNVRTSRGQGVEISGGQGVKFKKKSILALSLPPGLKGEWLRARIDGTATPQYRNTEPPIHMLQNYLKTALRNLLRERLYAVINTLGLDEVGHSEYF